MDLIVISTYQEARTVAGLLERIQGIPELDSFHVPDGTEAVVRALPSYGERVLLLERPGKDGLGAAYRAGFTWAEEHGYDVVVQMDADGSHPPESVPALVAALDGADVAIGSRYVAGGRTVYWPWHRRLISRAGNAYVRLLLALPVHDAEALWRVFTWRFLARPAGISGSDRDERIPA